MAIDDLEVLRDEMPEVFEERLVPSTWEDDWVFVPVDRPEALHDELGDRLDGPNCSNWQEDAVAPRQGIWHRTPGSVPVFEGEGHPGVTVPFDPSMQVPPPDYLGFYLPFHHYYPTWWGIYLVAEGVEGLAQFVSDHAGDRLEWAECMAAARVFIYGHESFHHAVESFATRLEVTHRMPLYKAGFRRLHDSQKGTDEWMEEALAGAHGVRKVERVLFGTDKLKKSAAVEALSRYLEMCPAGYRQAREFLDDWSFTDARARFAEESHFWSMPHLKRADDRLWALFPHAFTGISRVNSRVNYMVRRDSQLFTRISGRGHFLRYRDVAERLKKLAACTQVRQEGSHVIWQKPDGKTFPVPRHPRDIATGTLKAVIRQAGLDMSVSQFTAARV